MTDVEADLEQFLETYAEEFATCDPAVVASHFHEPAMLVAPGTVRALDSREDVERLFSAVFDDLAERDYGSSEAREVEVRPLGDGRAVATVRWIRYTTDGDVLERLDTTHLFRRTDDGWKMVVLAPHA